MPKLNDNMMNMITTYGVRVVGVLVLLFVAWIVSGWVKGLIAKGCEKTKVDATLSKFFSSLGKYIVLIVAGIASLGVFGIETTSFAAVLGASGLAVGLAMQGSLSNFSSGVMLLLFRPFKVDDVVTVSGQTGKVEEISLFSTALVTPDNRLLILPNSGVFGSTIENVTAKPTRRVDVAVGVDYSADLDRTREILTKAIEGTEKMLADPAPAVVLTGLGASSVDWVVRLWVNTGDYWAVKEAVTRSVKMALDQEKIGIPFPQVDVHFDGPISDALAGKLSRVS